MLKTPFGAFRAVNYFVFVFLFGASYEFEASSKDDYSDFLVALGVEDVASIRIEKIEDHIKIEYTLPEACSLTLNKYLEGISVDPYKNWDEYRFFAEDALLRFIPEDLKKILKKMKMGGDPTLLILHNVPIDLYIPPTPTHGNRPDLKKYDEYGKEIFNPDAKGCTSETVLMGMCSLLNAHPDYDEKEKDGTYINQIIPIDNEKSKSKISSAGSERTFEFHTENIYQEKPLKFLALLCLRGDPKVATRLVFLDVILKRMREKPHPAMSHEELLRQMQLPHFVMMTGPSFGEHSIKTILPILSKNAFGDRVFRFNVNEDRVVGITPEAEAVVEYLRELLSDGDFKAQHSTAIYLKAGDLILFNNWEVMHARDAFKIDPNNWRWLQRCYFMLNN